MKRPDDPTVMAIASLGGVNWHRWVEYLQESLAQAQDSLEREDDIREVRRLQGEVRTLKEQLKLIEDAPAIAAEKRR